jgi:arginine utilization protein RocB
MSLENSLNNLKATVQQANAMLKATENSINATMDALMKDANPEQLQSIQKNVISIKTLMNKAKKGENVDAEISSIAKTINNGRRNK